MGSWSSVKKPYLGCRESPKDKSALVLVGGSNRWELTFAEGQQDVSSTLRTCTYIILINLSNTPGRCYCHHLLDEEIQDQGVFIGSTSYNEPLAYLEYKLMSF